MPRWITAYLSLPGSPRQWKDKRGLLGVCDVHAGVEVRHGTGTHGGRRLAPAVGRWPRNRRRSLVIDVRRPAQPENV